MYIYIYANLKQERGTPHALALAHEGRILPPERGGFSEYLNIHISTYYFYVYINISLDLYTSIYIYTSIYLSIYTYIYTYISNETSQI